MGRISKQIDSMPAHSYVLRFLSSLAHSDGMLDGPDIDWPIDMGDKK